MRRVVHFEFSSPDPDRASAFYAALFGWEIQKWDGPAEYWLVNSAHLGERGIDGGILRSMDGSARTIVTMDVDSIDDMIAKVEAAGGTVVLPKQTIPGVGYQAYCTDPDGTIFGIHQRDASAAAPAG
jgi:predicted enzyme related to lactoylglutathione lyase